MEWYDLKIIVRGLNEYYQKHGVKQYEVLNDYELWCVEKVLEVMPTIGSMFKIPYYKFKKMKKSNVEGLLALVVRTHHTLIDEEGKLEGGFLDE